MFVNFANPVSNGNITTLALGEEGGEVSTKALGEEGGNITTQALGEEGGTVTTQALGEEGGNITTLALGEEGGQGVSTHNAKNVVNEADADKNGSVSKKELDAHIEKSTQGLDQLRKDFERYKRGEIQFIQDPKFEQRIAEAEAKLEAARFLKNNFDTVAKQDVFTGDVGTPGNELGISLLDIDRSAAADGNANILSQKDINILSKPVPPPPPPPPPQQFFQLIFQLLFLMLRLLGGQGNGGNPFKL